MSEVSKMWRRCSSCKAEIPYEATYWICSVSTCNRKRTGLAFCKTDCWDAHLGFENHRESWALERTAPTRAAAQAERRGQPSASAALRRVASASPPPARRESPPVVRRVPPQGSVQHAPASQSASQTLPREILIVASKLKHYVREASGMNTSDSVMDALSDQVRTLCDRAIENARRAERKTVLDRDVP